MVGGWHLLAPFKFPCPKWPHHGGDKGGVHPHKRIRGGEIHIPMMFPDGFRIVSLMIYKWMILMDDTDG
jgi:hypothetical protein